MDGFYLKLSLPNKECFSFKDISKFSGGRGSCLHPNRGELSHLLEPHKHSGGHLPFLES